MEPVRGIVRRVWGHFLKGKAVGVEFGERLVEVSAVGSGGREERFYVPYDKLVVGVGKKEIPLFRFFPFVEGV